MNTIKIAVTDVKTGQTIYRRGFAYTVTGVRNTFAGEPIVEINVEDRLGQPGEVCLPVSETVTVSA